MIHWTKPYKAKLSRDQIEAYERGEVVLYDLFKKPQVRHWAVTPELDHIYEVTLANVHSPFRNGKIFLRKQPWTDEEREQPVSIELKWES